jgi:hypothetical protein
MKFKVGDLVKHKVAGWIGHILDMTERDITIRVMYEPRGTIWPVILLFPSQLELLEKVL